METKIDIEIKLTCIKLAFQHLNCYQWFKCQKLTCINHVFDCVIHVRKDVRVHLELQSCSHNVTKLTGVTSVVR